MSRTQSLIFNPATFVLCAGTIIGIAAVGLLAIDVHPDTAGWVKGGYTNDPAVLCVNGHPALRRPDVTYGGLPAKHGHERDHFPFPLCLGQADTAEHVRDQPYPEASDKDELEKYACESYCAGRMDLTHARSLFDNWVTSYQQVFGRFPPHAEPGAENR
jgi:hypothetical protein